MEKIGKFGWENVPHPSYISDLASSDNHFLLMRWNRCDSNTTRRSMTSGKQYAMIFGQLTDFYHKGIFKLPKYYEFVRAAYIVYFIWNTFTVDHRHGLGNIVTSQPAGQGSIPGRVNFLVEGFPGFSLSRKSKVMKFGPHLSPFIIWLSYIVYERRRSLTLAVAGPT